MADKWRVARRRCMAGGVEEEEEEGGDFNFLCVYL